MVNPFASFRDKLVSAVRALRHRPWQGKDIAILSLLLLSVSAYAFREPLSAALAKVRAGAAGGETVSVFDLVVDRQNRQFVDILFDRPLGEGKVDQILDAPRPPSSRPSGARGSGRTPMRSGSSRVAVFRWPASTGST